ncbi:MAG: hypothetical protein U9N09_04865 [Euryarchaeota archaeon]|nr:hypothetical protein [Euryarchaeota archaeon]
MITVSDSTPLIHFGTIKRLDLLRSMYGLIATPIYRTDEETTMVMRTIEIKEIKYEVGKEQKGGIISRLKELYRDQLDIFTEGDFVGVRGDLHNYKRRNRILWIMSGGKHGKDLPTG